MTLLLRKCTVSLSKLTPTRHNYSLPLQTLFFSSSTKVSVPTADYLTTKHHISPETALKVSSTIPHIKNPLKTGSILSILKQTGFSGPQIDRMINKFPRILNVKPETMKTKLKMLEAKGFSALDTIHIFSEKPEVLRRSSEKCIEPSIDALKTVMGSIDAVCRIMKRFPRFLQRGLGKTLIPNMEFLKKRSELSSSQLADFVILHPRFFYLQPETIVDGARRLDEMGLEWSSEMYLHALRVVCSISEENLKFKINLFQGLGLPKNDVLQMFRRRPDVFGYAVKNLKDTMEVLLESGKVDPSLFLTTPGLLMHSLEKRIKPRLEVIKVLEDKGLLSKYDKPSFSAILHFSNKKFLERFVLSNSNVLGDDCVIDITKKLALTSAV